MAPHLDIEKCVSQVPRAVLSMGVEYGTSRMARCGGLLGVDVHSGPELFFSWRRENQTRISFGTNKARAQKIGRVPFRSGVSIEKLPP